MKKSVLAILLLCAAANAAQSPLGLNFPFGIPDHAVTGVSAAMGGSGTAAIDENFATALNPANAAIGRRAAYSAMISFETNNIDDNGASNSVSGYAPKLLSIIIPTRNAGNLAFSMQRRYNANLNFYTEETVKEEDVTRSSVIELNRVGGLTAWQAGWAYRFRNGLSVGIGYERLYFNIESRETFESALTYNLESGTVRFTTNTNETSTATFASDGIRFGMQVPVHEKVTLGAAAEYFFSSDNNGDATRVFWRNDNLTPRDTVKSKFSADLPPSFSIGAAYRPDPRWLLAADAHSTLWNLYDYYANGLGSYKARTTYGISTGARFIPAARNRLSSPYAERINYSAGLRYASLPYDGTGSHEYALSLGTGLPIPNDGGIIDIALSFGQRVDERYSGYSENIIGIKIGINGGRGWFQKDNNGR